MPEDPREMLPGGDPHGVRQPGVLAYFADRQAAQAAAEELRSAGLGPASVDTVRPQALDRADLRQQPQPRLDLENHADLGMPLDPATQHSTLVAVGAEGEDARRALEILRRHGGMV